MISTSKASMLRIEPVIILLLLTLSSVQLEEEVILEADSLHNKGDNLLQCGKILILTYERKLSAHRLVLSSCSSFFELILKITSTSNSVIYLSGVNTQNLGFMLDYMYQGEVQIFQEQLDDFLIVAQKLQIDGLISNQKNEEELYSQKIDDVFDYFETPSNLPLNPNCKKSIIVRKERSKDEVKLSNTENIPIIYPITLLRLFLGMMR